MNYRFLILAMLISFGLNGVERRDQAGRRFFGVDGGDTKSFSKALLGGGLLAISVYTGGLSAACAGGVLGVSLAAFCPLRTLTSFHDKTVTQCLRKKRQGQNE